MILREIRPINWGPFDGKSFLTVEPDTTVITAANDAGKSSLLRLLAALYQSPKKWDVEEDDLNIDYRRDSHVGDWMRDGGLECVLRFTATDRSKKFVVVGEAPSAYLIESGDDITITYKLAPKIQKAQVEVRRQGNRIQTHYPYILQQMPIVIGLSGLDRIGNIIDLSNPNSSELLLLRVAFGPNFNAEKIKGYARHNYAIAIRHAQDRFNKAVAQVVPPSLQLSFILEKTENQGEIGILPNDQQYGFAPLGLRGTGVQLLLSLLASLLEVQNIDDQVLIYLDEPETSLHADAQHLLRALLEELSKEERIQVIYATHSPSMINNMRPRSVRLLQRVVDEERVVTKIINRPADNNFVQIRTSLGISLSDSLQLAPVTIVVEGASEAIGMQMLLEKLHEYGVEGFEDVPLITPLCHILDGEGDTYVRQAKFAVSQNSKVVVFLDGDKRVLAKTREDLPSVAFIQIDNGEEIEQLIEPSVYFRAISQMFVEQEVASIEAINLNGFNLWLGKQDEKIIRKAFSKKVESWLDDIAPDFKYVKPRVLKEAISLIDNEEQIRYTELKRLVAEILKKLPSKD